MACQHHLLPFKHLTQSCENKAQTSSEAMLKLPKDPRNQCPVIFQHNLNTHTHSYIHTLSIGDNTLATHKQVCCASGLYFLVDLNNFEDTRALWKRSRKWDTLRWPQWKKSPQISFLHLHESRFDLFQNWKVCRLNLQTYYQKWWWLFPGKMRGYCVTAHIKYNYVESKGISFSHFWQLSS